MPALEITAVLLAANSISDIRRKEILLLPTILAGAAGAVRILLGTGSPAGLSADTGRLWQLLAALFPGMCLMGISAASGGRIGMGDALVVCAAGTWAGAEPILSGLFLAFLLVPAAALLLRSRKKRVKELPFIPFLCAGFLIQVILLGTG